MGGGVEGERGEGERSRRCCAFPRFLLFTDVGKADVRRGREIREGGGGGGGGGGGCHRFRPFALSRWGSIEGVCRGRQAPARRARSNHPPIRTRTRTPTHSHPPLPPTHSHPHPHPPTHPPTYAPTHPCAHASHAHAAGLFHTLQPGEAPPPHLRGQVPAARPGQSRLSHGSVTAHSHGSVTAQFVRPACAARSCGARFLHRAKALAHCLARELARPRRHTH